MAVVLRGNSFEKTERIKAALKDEFGLKGALRSPAHITLHRPFEWKHEKEQELVNGLRSFSFSGHVEIALSGFSNFGGRVLFINVARSPELEHLHRQLALYCKRELKLLNEYEDERGFHPHVTVAFRDLRKRHFKEVSQFLSKFVLEERFSVEGFSLLRLEEKWKEICFFPFSEAGNTLYNASK